MLQESIPKVLNNFSDRNIAIYLLFRCRTTIHLSLQRRLALAHPPVNGYVDSSPICLKSKKIRHNLCSGSTKFLHYIDQIRHGKEQIDKTRRREERKVTGKQFLGHGERQDRKRNRERASIREFNYQYQYLSNGDNK